MQHVSIEPGPQSPHQLLGLAELLLVGRRGQQVARGRRRRARRGVRGPRAVDAARRRVRLRRLTHQARQVRVRLPRATHTHTDQDQAVNL